jgi:hypothetical protein
MSSSVVVILTVIAALVAIAVYVIAAIHHLGVHKKEEEEFSEEAKTERCGRGAIKYDDSDFRSHAGGRTDDFAIQPWVDSPWDMKAGYHDEVPPEVFMSFLTPDPNASSVIVPEQELTQSTGDRAPSALSSREVLIIKELLTVRVNTGLVEEAKKNTNIASWRYSLVRFRVLHAWTRVSTLDGFTPVLIRAEVLVCFHRSGKSRGHCVRCVVAMNDDGDQDEYDDDDFGIRLISVHHVGALSEYEATSPLAVFGAWR